MSMTKVSKEIQLYAQGEQFNSEGDRSVQAHTQLGIWPRWRIDAHAMPNVLLHDPVLAWDTSSKDAETRIVKYVPYEKELSRR